MLGQIFHQTHALKVKQAGCYALGVVLLSTQLTACQTTNQDMGTLMGAAGGGLIGSQFGKGGGRVATTMLGALAGGFIGNRIGASMDQADRSKMSNSLETSRDGESYGWQNPNTGNNYTVVPKRTYYRGRQPCREYTTIAHVGGRKQRIYGTACRTADGDWQVQNEDS